MSPTTAVRMMLIQPSKNISLGVTAMKCKRSTTQTAACLANHAVNGGISLQFPLGTVTWSEWLLICQQAGHLVAGKPAR